MTAPAGPPPPGQPRRARRAAAALGPRAGGGGGGRRRGRGALAGHPLGPVTHFAPVTTPGHVWSPARLAQRPPGRSSPHRLGCAQAGRARDSPASPAALSNRAAAGPSAGRRAEPRAAPHPGGRPPLLPSVGRLVWRLPEGLARPRRPARGAAFPRRLRATR